MGIEPNNCNSGEGPLESSCWASSDNSYNDNKIRFPAPVPAGARVRARAEIVSVFLGAPRPPAIGEIGEDRAVSSAERPALLGAC